MPIEHLIEFWTMYFKYGFRYLFKFMIVLLQTLSPLLLSIKTDYKLYEILRVERKSHFWQCIQGTDKLHNDNDKVSLFFIKVLNDTNSIGTLYNYDIDKIDFQKEREYAFNQYLLTRFKNAALKVTLKGYEIESDDDEDDFKDCENCEDGFAEVYCLVCKIYLCEDCKDNTSGDHALNHAMKCLDIDDNTVNID